MANANVSTQPMDAYPAFNYNNLSSGGFSNAINKLHNNYLCNGSQQQQQQDNHYNRRHKPKTQKETNEVTSTNSGLQRSARGRRRQEDNNEDNIPACKRDDPECTSCGS